MVAGLRPGQVGSIADLAEAMGVTRPTIYEWQRAPGFPAAVDGVFHVRHVCEWRCGRENGRTKPKQSEEDAMLADADSPGLERYRLAKAQLAEMDLAEREKTLLPADTVREGVMAIAMAFRQAGETLQRQFGPEAHAILEGAVLEAESQINDIFVAANEDSGVSQEDSA